MKKILTFILTLVSICVFAQTTADSLGYHKIRLDAAGKILPWYSDKPGEAYNHVINLTWTFWENMRIDSNGIPYYLNHQVWKRDRNDQRGIGGDQIAMALSSWRLLYAYNGNKKVLDNMVYIADYYLKHSLSPAGAAWPDIPYPYNTIVQSGIYDGDMILGKEYTQPDKAASFGYELVNMYKITGNQLYLKAAEKIANTLVKHVTAGDEFQSPLPFRVNAITGKTGVLKDKDQVEKIRYGYTSNWAPALNLLKQLIKLEKGNKSEYTKSYNTILNWMKNYPLKNNKWGPFFEDVGLWSNTQINAITFAEFILENRDEFPNWKKESFSPIDWVYDELYNDKWDSYGAAVVNEQTHYRVPGNSHTARQGAVELLYASCTGDSVRKSIGLKQLNWATYMVNHDGENTYPNNETWLTDGYGDYIRHYLKAFAAFADIAPDNENHLLKTSSVVKSIVYNKKNINYLVFDRESSETFRLTSKPKTISLNGKLISEVKEAGKNNCWLWKPLAKGGVLIINHSSGAKISISL